MLYNMSPSDIERSFVGSYLALKKDNVNIPIYVTQAGINNHIVYRQLDADDDDAECSISLNDDALITQHPDSGYVRDDGSAVYCMRMATKQWHRGVRPRCMMFRSTGARPNDPTKLTAFKESMLLDLYNPTYYSWNMSSPRMSSGCVLDKNFAMHTHRRYKYPVLYYRGHVVGEVISEDSVRLVGKWEYLRAYFSRNHSDISIVT